MAKRERHSLATNKSASLEADGYRLSILQERLPDPQFAGKDSRSKNQPAPIQVTVITGAFGSFSYVYLLTVDSDCLDIGAGSIDSSLQLSSRMNHGRPLRPVLPKSKLNMNHQTHTPNLAS